MSTMYTFRPVRGPAHDFGTSSVGGGRKQKMMGLKERRPTTNRVLFTPVNHCDLDAFLDREFQKQATLECQRWDFDFVKGEPMAEASHYEWRPFTPTSTGLSPPPPPRKKSHSPSHHDEDITDLYAQPIAYDERPPMLVADFGIDAEEMVVAAASPSAIVMEATPLKKTPSKQSKITDYLQSRKRMLNPAPTKKELEGMGPQKVARLTFSKS